MVLRPIFPKSSATSGIAEFFLEPAKAIAVVDGVRPRVEGKFLYVGDEKFYVRGVTYGPFRPDENGCEYHNPEMVDRDFAQMAARRHQCRARLYGAAALAARCGPAAWFAGYDRAAVGRALTFLDNKKLARDIEHRVRLGVQASCRTSGAPLLHHRQ